ncbi:hypothetical protein GGF46_005289 [Coemansia sp. RSA 552]|nr:hypothetical protein GGF46_005289 [Coemansia sp. RSA 552]
MFGLKKPKGRRNIRKKGADSEVADSESTDIVKRTTPAKPTKDGPHPYTQEEIQALKKDTEKPDTQTTAYPFSTQGIPNAQDIYMAKKLRRQRQAAQKMGDEDSGDEQRKEEDFISLSDDMASSHIQVSHPDTLEEPEDTLDTVIVDPGERAEFGRVARQAMGESIEQVHEDELSEWENEQLRSAGVATPRRRPKGSQANGPLRDEGFEFDMEQFRFMLVQEENQLKLDQDRLETTNRQLAASSKALEELDHSIEHARKQYDHFASLAKSTI